MIPDLHIPSQMSKNIILQRLKRKHPNQIGISILMFLSSGDVNATKIHLKFLIAYLASVLSPLTA